MGCLVSCFESENETILNEEISKQISKQNNNLDNFESSSDEYLPRSPPSPPTYSDLFRKTYD